MEIWDAYNAQFEKIENTILVRGEKIPDGLFHLVSEILVKHIDGTYLLMQRDFGRAYGGMWEATAGGSALSGETPFACAERELREETGMIASELTEVGCLINHKQQTIYVEFLCITDWDKTNISLQEGETIAFKWVNRDELVSMRDDELATKRIQNFITELSR